nr:hypothetical protein [candidate division Zixibacteria bacterium]
MSTKEIQEKLVENMKRWQKIENASVASTGRIIESTDNPVVRMIMEIIQRDSQFHYRVQEFIADSLTTKTVAFSTDELGEVWDMIEKHIQLEEKTMELAKESLGALKGKKMLVQEYLLNYLMEDEAKHNKILGHLEKIKKGAYPYA